MGKPKNKPKKKAGKPVRDVQAVKRCVGCDGSGRVGGQIHGDCKGSGELGPADPVQQPAA